MQPPSSIWSPFDGHWRTALTPQEWAARFRGPVPPAFARWFVAGPRARYVPCIHAAGCRQPHRVRRIRDGQCLAVPEAPDCESFEIAGPDTETTRLDRDRFARHLAATLRLESASVERVSGRVDVIRFARIGSSGSPCFVAFSSSAADLSAACDTITAQCPHGSLVLTPAESHATECLRSVMNLRRGCLLSLPEVTEFNSGGDLVARIDLSERLAQLTAEMWDAQSTPALGGRTRFARGNTWPHARPVKPAWSDVVFAMHPQEVAISFGESQAKFDYRNIDGFTDHRGGKKANRLWTLLRAFAMMDGVLPLPTKSEDPARVRTLADLDRVLCRFFGLRDPAFERDSAERQVRARFRLRLKT